MTLPIAFGCRCGEVKITMPGGTAAMGTHIICYCKDCRAFARHLGQQDMLLERGGTRVFHTRPDRLRIQSGAEHIKCLRLSPKGALRWYAGCCSTPLMAGNERPRLPFVSIVALSVADPQVLGPVLCHAFTENALPGTAAVPRTHGVARVVWRILRRAVWATLIGKAGKNPLFPNGKPISEPKLITREERAAAMK